MPPKDDVTRPKRSYIREKRAARSEDCDLGPDPAAPVPQPDDGALRGIDSRLRRRIQLTIDGHDAGPSVVEDAFDRDIDYACCDVEEIVGLMPPPTQAS